MRRFAWLCVAAGLLVGCAAAPAIQSDADRRACDELIRAMREAWALRPGTVVQRERYDGRLSPGRAVRPSAWASGQCDRGRCWRLHVLSCLEPLHASRGGWD
jgi:hypothetical protein